MATVDFGKEHWDQVYGAENFFFFNELQHHKECNSHLPDP